MNILVVDDLISVVNGIIKGIDWSRLGVLGVYKAHNAYEAKVLLNNLKIDILLTDIEMPGESGLELVAWVRQQNMDMECIFLSSHADFDYARRALQMGSFEYVLLPCPYEEIAAVIHGAMEKLRGRREQDKLYHYGKTVADDAWLEKVLFRSSLEPDKNAEAIRRLCELGKLDNDVSGYLCMMDIVSQDIHLEQWDGQLLEFTLDNVIQELMAPMHQHIFLLQLTLKSYIFFCFDKDGYMPETHIFSRQLALVRETMLSSLRIQVEILYEVCQCLHQLPEVYMSLDARMKNTLTVGNAQDGELQPLNIKGDENRWMEYYETGYVCNLSKDVAHYLNTLQEKGTDSRDMRMGLHMDLVQLMYKYLDKNTDSVMCIFETKDEFLRYTRAYESTSELIWMAERITEYILRRTSVKNLPQDPVKMVEEYVHSHIGQDIKRSDLADCVHLNIDYLSRIFKREKGMTLNDYIVMEKLNTARNLLRTTRLPVSLIATKVGYSNFSYFSKLYKKSFGITPAEERS